MRRDDIKSDASLLRELEDQGWAIWVVARRGEATIAGPALYDVYKRCLKPHTSQKGT